ncbi:MAG TPA: hypothetical protein VF039_05770 [Longimicrobiales bacterium]
MRRVRALLPALLLATAAGACGEPAEDGIGREDFVATFVDLREAAVRGTLDDAARDSILAAHDATEAELRAYIEARRADPEALADTWRVVLDSIVARDSVAAARDSVAAAGDSAAASPDTGSTRTESN